MKRTAIFLIAVLVLSLVPAVAVAQTDEEKAAAIAALEEAVDGLGGETAEEWAESLAALSAALDGLKAVFPDLDYGALDSAIADLEAAIEGGDLDEIAAAGEAVAAAGAAVAAEAEAEGEGEGEGEGGSAPAGGVATGAGGTAGGDGVPMWIIVAGLVSLLAAAGLYGRARRSES